MALFVRARVLVRRLAELWGCGVCGSSSYIMLPNGRSQCMDCGATW